MRVPKSERQNMDYVFALRMPYFWKYDLMAIQVYEGEPNLTSLLRRWINERRLEYLRNTALKKAIDGIKKRKGWR